MHEEINQDNKSLSMNDISPVVFPISKEEEGETVGPKSPDRLLAILEATEERRRKYEISD